MANTFWPGDYFDATFFEAGFFGPVEATAEGAMVATLSGSSSVTADAVAIRHLHGKPIPKARRTRGKLIVWPEEEEAPPVPVAVDAVPTVEPPAIAPAFEVLALSERFAASVAAEIAAAAVRTEIAQINAAREAAARTARLREDDEFLLLVA